MTGEISDRVTLREGRAAYFAANGLPPDGGYADAWVRADIGPIPFAFPNTAGRKAIVPAHDLHHVLTGYATDLVGEAEVGAWELGSGMPSRMGRSLALRVLGFVLPWEPRRLFAAFVRGRHTGNLMDRPCDAALLDRSVGEVRVELGLDTRPAAPAAADRRAFAGQCAKAVAIVWGPLVPLAVLAWWWLA